MVEITFFELHLDGADLTANAPFAGTSGDEGGDTADEDEDQAGGTSIPIGPLLGLIVLVVLLVAAKKLLGGSPPEDITVETE